MFQPVTVTIQYCTEWEYEPQAVSLAEHLLTKYQLRITSLTLVPSLGGVFEVWINNEEVHSRRVTGKFPTDEAIDAAIDERLKPGG